MIWKSKLLSKFPEIIHGSTSKSFGVVRLGSAEDEVVIKNRVQLAETNGFDLDQVVLTYQEHGNQVCQVSKADMGRGAKVKSDWVGPADSLITNEAGPVLVVSTADCVPIFFYHPKKKVIAIAHAGWQGTIKNMVGNVIKSFETDFNGDPSDLLIAIGPAISGQKYDVSEVEDDRVLQFANVFGESSDVIIRSAGKVALDLKRANKELLMRAGVKAENLEVCDICTYEQSDSWASYRKDPENLAYSIWSFISLRK